MAKYDGDLFSLFEQETLPAFQFNKLLEITEIIDKLHENKIQHRDLKLENFLFKKNNNLIKLKVSDFGTSCFFCDKKCLEDSSYTPFFAPYDLKEVSDYTIYPKTFDYYSIGMMFVDLKYSEFEYLRQSMKLLTIENMKKIRESIEKDQSLENDFKQVLFQLLSMPKRESKGWSDEKEPKVKNLDSFREALKKEITKL